VLLTVTPEYSKIKASRQPGAGRAKSGTTKFSMKPEYRTVDGVKVRYAEGGNQEGPLLLMLCPLPQSILCYDPVWDTLGAKCRLVALDLPGFGRSDGGLDFMSFEAQSNFLDKFLRELGLSQMHIVGPDVGMAAALHYAIHQEHDIASLIIGDGPGILPTSNGSIINKAVDSAFWRMMFKIAGSQAFVEGAYRLACVNYIPNAAEVADYVASYSNGRLGPITYWFKTYPENLATLDPHLENLDLPIQLFWGDMDYFLLRDNADRLHRRLKHSDLRVFEHCGHFCYQDKSDEFAEMVLTRAGGRYKNT
jgi:pimeloyl-ACP methyl ester carboxylesterase